MTLSTSSNFAKPDDAFRAIVEAHRGLSEAQSADLDAALVLVLANHIGDIDGAAMKPSRSPSGGCSMPASSNSSSSK